MAENKKKEVTVSKQFEIDISIVFEYSEETFGYNAAKIFIGEIYNHVSCHLMPGSSISTNNFVTLHQNYDYDNFGTEK